MRILAISELPLDRTTGTGRYVYELCRRLGGHGAGVLAVVPNIDEGQDHSLLEDLASGHVRLLPVLGRSPFDKLGTDEKKRQISEICERVAEMVPFDVVHVMYGHYSWELAARLSTSTRIMTIHNVPPREYEMPFASEATALTSAANRCYRLAVSFKHARLLRKQAWDGIITNSLKTKSLVEEVMAGVNVPIRAIGMGPSVPWGGSIRRGPAPQDQWRLVTVAAIKQHKQLHLIPAISDRLARAGIHHSWEIAGPSRSPKYQALVDREVVRYGAGNRIRFLGRVEQDELVALLDAAHLYVQPSLEEGFCITVLDALARRLPVVATRTGAIEEMLCGGGGISTATDVEAIALGIERLIREYPRFAGEESRWEACADTFSWAKVVEDTLRFYEAVLSREIREKTLDMV